MTQILAHLWGDYILQSEWMAQNKTKRSWPALVHALLYSLLFIPFCFWFWYEVPDGMVWIKTEHFRWLPWLVIFGSHFLIDRFRVARYVVWMKNFLAPEWVFTSSSVYKTRQRNSPWKECKDTGYSPATPIWLSTWLLIIADNTLHLTINYLALRYL